MHVVMRKLYMSILACMLVLVTTVVTTYAWAGISKYSSTERFDVNLNQNSDDKFSLQISLDGIHFSDAIELVDLKRIILKNMDYYQDIDNLFDENINNIFSNIEMKALSTYRKENKLGSFVCLEDITKENFLYKFDREESQNARFSHFEFDLYLSYKYEVEDIEDDIILNEKHNIYLNGVSEMLTGKTQTHSLSNPFEFDNYFQGTIFKSVKVNSASAARVALSVYPVVDKGNPALYDNVDATNLTIYQGGTALPTLNNNVYSFGGMLPERDNIGFLQYNDMHRPMISKDILDDFIANRGNEIALNDAKNSWIVTQQDGLTINKMVKVKVVMWIEGFDADCFEVINKLPINLNLVFSSTASDK